MPLKAKTARYIERFHEVHPVGRYLYDKLNFTHAKKKVNIYCTVCNVYFQQRPDTHIAGSGCRPCSDRERSEKQSTSFEVFLEKLNSVHPKDSFTIDEATYKNSTTKVIANCNTCQYEFEVLPNSLLQGSGCYMCAKQEEKNTEEDIIRRFKETHPNNLYNYDRVNYIHLKEPVEIGCNACGEYFFQIPISHINGKGCRPCSFIRSANIRRRDNESFIALSDEKFGPNRAGFDRLDYKNCKLPVELQCLDCNEYYFQTPDAYMSGWNGCVPCSIKGRTYTTEEWVVKARERHGSTRYLYDRSIYVGVDGKVEIGCAVHNEYFWQRASVHTAGKGCPRCSESKGEAMITRYLQENNIQFERECKVPDFMYRYDFYLPRYNIYIEYHGEQHFKFIPFFHKDLEGFELSKFRDREKEEILKIQYATLVVITYEEETQETIDSLLSKAIRSGEKNLSIIC